jgi:hypothetical protein
LKLLHGHIIGHRLFVDGTRRPIYENAHGQYALDDGGQRVYGLYLISEDEGCDAPLIVELESA